VAEITFRTAAAAEVMRQLSAERPDLILGAGTVLTVENLARAKECGARFAVAPGLNPGVVECARELGMPMMPGVMTPSEVEQGLALGCRALKFFPAQVAGGTAMLKALSAPYKHTGVRFIPTGGVTAENLPEYLKIDTVLAVGGTWIATKDDIAARRWEAIREHCAQAVEIVKSARQKKDR